MQYTILHGEVIQNEADAESAHLMVLTIIYLTKIEEKKKLIGDRIDWV